MGDLILLRKNKRSDRKVGMFSFAWLYPYFVFEITPSGVAIVKRQDGGILKVKSNLSQFKLYVEEKTTDTGGDTTEFTVAVDNEKLSATVNTGTSTPLDCDEINYWDTLPNRLVEKILLCTMKESGFQLCQTYQNIIQTCRRLVYVTLLYLHSLK